MHAARCRAPGRVGDRGGLPLEGVQALRQLPERALVEARADLARIDQPTLVVIHSEQQRTDPHA
jgi:hypothetical protein